MRAAHVQQWGKQAILAWHQCGAWIISGTLSLLWSPIIINFEGSSDLCRDSSVSLKADIAPRLTAHPPARPVAGVVGGKEGLGCQVSIIWAPEALVVCVGISVGLHLVRGLPCSACSCIPAVVMVGYLQTHPNTHTVWSWGSEPGSGLSAYPTGRGAIQGRTPRLHCGPAIMGSDPTRGRQCGHTGPTRKTW